MSTNNGFAIAALVMGILSLLLSLVPILGFIVVVLAITFGFVGLNKSKQLNGEGKGLAIAGLVMGFIGLFMFLFMLIGAIAYFGVLSPGELLPERTIFTSPIANMDNAVIDVSENTFAVALKNNANYPLTIPLVGTTDLPNCANPVLTGMYNNNAITPETEIPMGSIFVLVWDCPGSAKDGETVKATLSFNYINTETTMTRTHTGSVVGVYK